MKFSDKYPDVEMFQEPMIGIYVAPDFYPCAVCKAPTRFIDYVAHVGVARGVPVCSEECCAKQVLGRSL